MLPAIMKSGEAREDAEDCTSQHSQLVRRWTWAAVLMLAAVTAAAYFNAAHDTLVYDDKYLNTRDFSLDAQSLVRLFHEHLWAGAGVGTDVYRPLLMFLLAVEGAIHGVRARWFHLTNIALHVITTLVLFGLLLELLRGKKGAWSLSLLAALLAALVFGVHPIHTEVVDSVFNRSEMLATLGVLGALWTAWRWGERHPVRAWASVSLIYLAALLCRESAAPLPALVLLVLIALRPELILTPEGRRRLRPVALLLVAGGVYFLLRRSALSLPAVSVILERLAIPSAHAAPAAPDVPPALELVSPSSASQRLGLVLCMIREGLRLVVWPHPLRAGYDGLGAGGPIHALAIVSLVAMSAILWRRSAPGFLLGLGFFLVALLPSTRIFSSFSAQMAERYLYLPSVGLSLGLAIQLQQWLTGQRKWPIVGAMLAVVALWMPLTLSRNADWSSDQALWEREVRVAPQSARAWRSLLNVYLRDQRLADAAHICDAQLILHPQDGQLHTNCAVVYDRLSQPEKAEVSYQRAVELGLGALGHANLARFYQHIGRQSEAKREYLQAIELETVPVQKHYRRGQFLRRFYPERIAEAEAEFRRALEIQPLFAPARTALEQIKH